ncbi:hypothetical protein [Rhizobium leguminosarum]|uniref:hypothetical protein n=1 Tax=Rhizobium leguminosarum TaxID=384 RepID=UPI00103AACD4|nr:hypothetical protein [Rhizobium leguminosarum]TBY42260.1 hypothetical protein E0H54_29460 [Rhizobium leguminosarum bv. viciae]
MQFRLVFDGELRPRKVASLGDIHAIRMALHPQLKELWQHSPFQDVRSWKELPVAPGFVTTRTEVAGHTFIPAVSSRVFLYAELDILIMRQQYPGVLISEQGDIDNRVKTLFDALRLPSKGEITKLSEEDRATLAQDEEIYCLLEDDRLVTKVTVATDRRLGRPLRSTETLAVIQVQLKASKLTMDNISVVG